MVSRPSTSWRTVRVFISSTFRDMHGERDHLVQVVFPALRERLQRYRVHLVDIDLRWGVTEEQSESDRALELCLEQVHASRPFFLCMLGERYGYVPGRLPQSTIAAHSWVRDWPRRSVTELEVRAGMRGDSGVHAKPIFFLRDPSFIDDVPATKRGDVQGESVEARTKLEELKQVVCSADGAVSVERYTCAYRGLRVSPRLLKDARLPDGTGALDGAMRDGLVEPAEYAALEPSLQDVVCTNGVVYTGRLESFGRSVEDRLWTAIREELALPEQPPESDGSNSLDEEAQYHDAFIESRLRVHVERTGILRRLLAHTTGKRGPLLVLAGPPGSGKSSLMARLVAALRTRAGDRGHRAIPSLVVAHFVGASPQSANLRQMLRRFCLILDGERTPVELPDTTDELIEAFRARLQSHPPAQRVVLVIDGVNQLDPVDNAHAMHWLPRELPPHVRVIVSCVDDAASARREHRGATTDAARVLAALRHRPHRRVDVTPLSDAELLEIVRVVPSLSAKTLDRGQIALLLDNPATRNPLFLLVALEELRGFGSFEQLPARIAAFPREGDTLTQIFEQVMERLEEEFGYEVVRRCLSYLCVSRFGLSEREIVELVVPADADESNGAERVATLYAVLRQIRAYTQYRGTLVDFFHANFKRAVLERYLASPQVRAGNHRSLANYFREKADPGGTADWAGDSPRALRELPHHLAEAGDGDALRALVLDGAFLHAKLRASDPQTLIDDFNLALGLTAAGSPELEMLTELRDALRLSIRQLARHPAELLTQLNGRVNRDAGGMAAALESFASRAGSPWLRVWTHSLTPTGPLLWQMRAATGRHGAHPSKVSLSSDAARIVVAAAGGIVSMYSVDGGPPLVVLEGDSNAGAVLDMVVREDGRTAMVLRENGSIESWDLIDQALRRTERVKATSSTGEVTAVAFDGKNVMLGTSRGAMAWRRVDDPPFRRKWQAHAASVAAVGFDSSAARAVTSHVDGRLLVWDVTAKGVVPRDSAGGPAELKLGREGWHDGFGESPAFALAVSRDGSTAFAGHAEKIFSNLYNSMLSTPDIRGLISQVDLATGRVTTRLEADAASPVIDLDVTPDGRFCVTLMRDGGVKLWDLRKADRQVALGQHNESPPTVGITPDRRRVLSASDDGFLIVWELTTGEVHRLRGYRDDVFELRVSPDSRYALILSDGFCNVWDLAALGLGTPLGDMPKSGSTYTVWIRDAVVLPTSDRAVTVTGDGVITTWDMQTGKPVGEPYTIGRDVRNASFSTSGRWLLIATEHSLALYDLSQQVSVRGFRLSGDTRVARIFPASDGGRFRVELTSGDPLFWDPEDDAPVPQSGDAIRFAATAVTPDGRYALGYDGATVTLIDVAANASVASYTADSGFTSFALSHDGQIVALGGANKEVHVLVLMPV